MPTLVLIPGLSSTSLMWEPLADAIGDAMPVRHADVPRDDTIPEMAARLLTEVDGDLMRCLHHEDRDAARDVHRPAHRAWVQSGGEARAAVLFGSAMVDESGAPIGNFGILEAVSLKDALAFAEGDPFNQAGIVATIDLTPLPDTFQAHRITDPMTARA